MQEGGPPSGLPELPESVLAGVLRFVRDGRDVARASAVSQSWRRAAQVAHTRRKRLSFAKTPKMADAQAPGLVQRMPNLEALDLWGCSNLTDAALQEISEAPCVGGLEEVSLWGCSRVGDAGVRPLLERAPNLRKLNLGGTGVSGASVLAASENCTQLERLNLWRCCGVPDGALLEALGRWRHLREVQVWGLSIDAEQLLRAHVGPRPLIVHGLPPITTKNSLKSVYSIA